MPPNDLVPIRIVRQAIGLQRGLLVQLGRRTFELSSEHVDHPDALAVSAISPRKVRLHVKAADGS